MRRNLLLFFSITLLFTACKTELSTQKKIAIMQQMDWLRGVWVVQTSSYTYFESWKKINDTLYRGKSVMLISRDTVFSERMSIEANKQSIILTTRNSQNPSSSIQSFLLSKVSKDKIVFFNRWNKEEQMISYILKSPDNMYIYVEGDKKSVASYTLEKIMK